MPAYRDTRDFTAFARPLGAIQDLLPAQRAGDAVDFRGLLHRDGSVFSVIDPDELAKPDTLSVPQPLFRARSRTPFFSESTVGLTAALSAGIKSSGSRRLWECLSKISPPVTVLSSRTSPPSATQLPAPPSAACRRCRPAKSPAWGDGNVTHGESSLLGAQVGVGILVPAAAQTSAPVPNAVVMVELAAYLEKRPADAARVALVLYGDETYAQLAALKVHTYKLALGVCYDRELRI